MAKDKIRKISEEEKKETLFYYEMVGVILIVISAVLILQLGQIGHWLYVLFKVLFGDYYFIYVFLTMYLGFYSLFVHKAFNIKNHRFIGFIFMGLGIMIFCHIPVHNYVVTKEGSYFSNTWSIYYSYLSVGYGEVLGGGLIGAGLFFLAFKLFGLLGVCLIAALIIILGFSLLINKSIGEIFKFVIERLKGVRKLTSNFNNFFKYEIGSTIPETKKSIYLMKKQIPIKLLDDIDNNIHYTFQEKLSNETKTLINSVFNNLALDYKEVEMIISYKCTTFKYIVFTDFNSQVLIKKLKDVIDEKILFGKNNNKVIIQINNNHPQYFCLKHLLLKQHDLLNNYIIPLGVDTNNRLIEIDFKSNSGILIICKDIGEYYIFVLNLLITLLVKMPTNNYEVYLFDDMLTQSNHKEVLNNFVLSSEITSIMDYLDNIKKEVDEVLVELDKMKVNNIDEYNSKMEINSQKNFFKQKIYFLAIERINHDPVFEEKLFYILSSSKKTGITIILGLIQDSLSNILLSLFDNKLIFRNSLYVNPYPNSKCLQPKNDVLFIQGIKETRLTLPEITESEIAKIKKYIDKK